MKAEEIIKKFPLSVETIKTWYLNQMKAVLVDKDLPSDFEEYLLTKGLSDDTLIDLFDNNPRSLFDVFDENNVIIENVIYPDKTFSIKIGKQATTKSWKTRKESERFAIEAAFEILENQLSSIVEE